MDMRKVIHHAVLSTKTRTVQPETIDSLDEALQKLAADIGSPERVENFVRQLVGGMVAQAQERAAHAAMDDRMRLRVAPFFEVDDGRPQEAQPIGRSSVFETD